MLAGRALTFVSPIRTKSLPALRACSVAGLAGPNSVLRVSSPALPRTIRTMGSPRSQVGSLHPPMNAMQPVPSPPGAATLVAIPPRIHTSSSSPPSPSSPTPNSSSNPEPAKPTMSQLVARYGVVATFTYLVLSQSIFWLMYLGLRLSGLDTQTLLDQLPSEWTARFGGSEGGKLPGWATDYVDPTVFGVAFILSKVLVPLKLMVVVWATPKVARAWSRLGAAKAGVAVVAVEGQAVEAKEE